MDKDKVIALLIRLVDFLEKDLTEAYEVINRQDEERKESGRVI